MKKHSNLCRQEDSVLVLVDMQEKLSAAMPEVEIERVLINCARLLEIAGEMEIPVMVTEQYPQGLGASFPELIDKLPAATRILSKTGFSCCAADGFNTALQQTHRQQIILAGQESHVCVLQTALALIHQDYQVYVVEDAVCSRQIGYKHTALQRLLQQGVTITNHECVLFEWLQDSRHPMFKTVSAMLR